MEHLKTAVDKLCRCHGMIMLKAGTEWEDMDFTEIAFLNNLVSGKIPLMVKVGGVEARTDIRNLKQMGVGALLGPLIESEYALAKFIATVNEIFADGGKKPVIAINIETINAVSQIDDIINSAVFAHIDSVVIGRLDLSRSMGRPDVDDEAVFEITQKIAAKLHPKKIPVSIGGFVNPQSAAVIKENFKVDWINTIHTVFDLKRAPDISQAIVQAVKFEIELYEAFKTICPSRAPFYEDRIEMSRKKIERSTN